MSKVHTQRSQFIMMFFAFSFGMILSNLLGQAKENTEEEPNNVVMIYRGLDKTIQDLPEPIASEFKQLKEESENKQREMLYTVALQWQLEEFAVEQQLPLEQAGNKLFDLAPPSDDEINAFYVAQADKIAKPFYEVKERIFQHLQKQKAVQARHDKIAELLEKGDLAVLMN